jgi:hypothetical protein
VARLLGDAHKGITGGGAFVHRTIDYTQPRSLLSEEVQVSLGLGAVRAALAHEHFKHQGISVLRRG